MAKDVYQLRKENLRRLSAEWGGLYPPERDRWPPWVWLLLAISALGALGHLLK